MALNIKRIKEYQMKYGMSELILRIIIKPFKKLFRFIMKKIRIYSYVFSFDPCFTPDRLNENFSFGKFTDSQSLPNDLKDVLIKEFGLEKIKNYMNGVDNYGCTLWIGYHGKEPACLTLSRIGNAIPYWFFPIGQNDHVLMMVYTLERFRGNSLSPTLMFEISKNLKTENNKVFSDCKTFNKPSIRSMEKSGFKKVAKIKSIREDWSRE